ncbi:HD domain-containing protein [Konateibacter massiliensis]|uniref:HD domain-containing protein n=1 Tax=Konateibacter massiliensis TaxID=2002841 RepID=UPI000C15F80B|nr:HD domain-containing protein [Konateibacter massiliensis]
MSKITYEQIRENKEINTYIQVGNEVLGVLGYTDHSKIHAIKVAETAGKILRELGYSKKEIELAKIAGFMHDIGNSVNRNDHAHNGALMAFQILKELGMDCEDIAAVVTAIGNHDEKTGTAVTPISAAVILADKTDVRRNRVRNKEKANFDNHDRVNYAAIKSKVMIDKEKGVIHLDIKLDESISSILDYFEIFLNRMLMCKRAAEILNAKFKFTANGNKVA